MSYYVIDYAVDRGRYRKGVHAPNQTAATNLVCAAYAGYPVEFRKIAEFNSKKEALNHHDKTGL